MNDAVPKVSVVIASYNYAAFLPGAIQSVQAQTFADWECIIVDDCSTDNTPDVAAALVAQDSRIRYYRNAQNQGEARSRNIGNGHARGEWIAVLDADDSWRPDKLGLQMNALLAQPHLVWSSTQATIFWDTGERFWLDDMNFPDDVDAYLHRECFVVHSSVVVRRDALLAVGGYEPVVPIGVDWDLWLRLMNRYGPKAYTFLNKPLVRYRVHNANMSGGKNWRRLLEGERGVVWRSLRRGNWWIKRPLAAWQVIDHQLHRETVKYAQAGCQKQAFVAQTLRAALYPQQKYRWRLAARQLKAVLRPAPAEQV